MKVEEIEIHAGTPSFAFTAVRRLEVKCEATTALSPAPTVEEANGRLRTMAAKVGANAVIEVEYKSGVSMTSWKSMKATGLAVIRESDERPCPVCAETIKRAASKCRFCGADVTSQAVETPATGSPASTAAIPAEHQEPLRETNNPQMWLIVLAVITVFGMLISMAG
ncbi:MAG: heavy metal-binding domain-containing protein [Sphingobium sp.]|nr:heavy metal-binding domain-containing protein [Sphingobium sp.]